MQKIGKIKVVIGLSGGVDSAVTALLLKEKGYDVLGIFMQNWESANDDPYCTAEQDLSDAKAVCNTLEIPFQTVNFAKEYWASVFQHCLDEFQAGRTPNPDIWCNREIKFKAFLKHALSLGADFVATGHYARKKESNGEFHMLKGLDPIKDQSYFLYTLGQHELKHALFPIGELEKSEVRRIAEKAGLINYNKKDSTGICFIGERNFKNFLTEFLLARPGDIQTVDGNIVGKHDGVIYYTLGQRKGLHIGGVRNSNESAWYVVDKDINNNRLIVGQGHDHPLLFKNNLECTELHWVTGSAPEKHFKCSAKTRYHQPEQRCHVKQVDDDRCEVIFEKPQRAITPGQSIVLYDGMICLGGGTIV